MRKPAISVVLSLVAVLVAVDATAQAWRGMARVEGRILDQDGKPVKGARVVLRSKKGEGGPDAVTTDANGRWAALGLIGGPWDIDVEAAGFLTRKVSVNLSELTRLPPMKITLEPAPPPPPPQEEQQPKESIQVGGVEIAPEIAQALEAANNFMREQKWKEAAAEYEKALTVLSNNNSLKFALARAYYGAGELKKAIAQLQAVYTADTGNVTAATLLADMLLEDGQYDQAKIVLNAMPPGALSDPQTVMNLGIRFINLNKAEDGWKYFNDAVSIAPDVAAAYYYRGIAALQLKKMKEAKADLQKVVQIAPESEEAKDAKDLLAQMK